MHQARYHIQHMLNTWMPIRDQARWVLGVIYKTEGSCYRKAGAMMLFSDQGHQLGILSGGCLESDVRRNARKVMEDGRARQLRYDDSDEDDAAFQLGVGCGGVVYLQLLPVKPESDYLGLKQVYENLLSNIDCVWNMPFVDGVLSGTSTVSKAFRVEDVRANTIVSLGSDSWLQVSFTPLPHILVVGGGSDAIPLTRMASEMGWRVSLWDPRPSQGRAEYFSSVAHILETKDAGDLGAYVAGQKLNAIVLMSHHKTIDADALKAVHDSDISYLAILGPTHRKQEVLDLAGIDESDIRATFRGPAGLPIGGDLPESIALSIIAECHGVLHQSQQKQTGKASGSGNSMLAA